MARLWTRDPCHTRVVSEDLVVTSAVTIPAAELLWKFTRSSGPGGQSVNTTDSRATVTFDLAGSASIPDYLRGRALNRLAARLVDGTLSITADEQRSQLQNRRAAEQRLAGLLRGAFAPPPPPRRPTKPSCTAIDKRIQAKKSRGHTKRMRGSAHDGE